jgi:hypothetical protein
MNLNDIIQSAQGGQAIDNIAAKFGLSPEQAQAAVQALIPALSAGLQHASQNPGALGQILGHLGDGPHQASYQDGGAAESSEAQAAGEDAVGTILGGDHKTDQIAQHAAAQSGLSPDLLKSMLPQITSVVLGGVAASMHENGLGGVLGQLAQAAQGGGLGGLLGGLFGGGSQPAGAPAAPQGAGGGWGSVLGGLAGSLLAGKGGAQQAGLDPSVVQAGMDALGKMFQPGPGGSSALQDEISQILRKH